MPNDLTLDLERPRVLRDNAEYEIAAAEIDRLLDADPEPGTAEHDRLELLTVLVGAYDAEHVDLGESAVTPQDVVRFVARQNSVTAGELATLLGGRSRLSEFLNGRRALSLGQILALRERFGLSADVLVGAPTEGKPRRPGGLAGRGARKGAAKRGAARKGAAKRGVAKSGGARKGGVRGPGRSTGKRGRKSPPTSRDPAAA